MTRTRLLPALRAAALAFVLATLAVWAITGAHLGWTQTSVIETRRDDITGIDYPVRRDAFIAGVEVPVLGLAAAGALLAATALFRRRPSSHA